MSTLPSDKLYVTFWGTRGSISTPGATTEKYGGNTPCVYCECQGARLIMDAGTGIRNLGLDLMQSAAETGPLNLHLLLSHTHWDHIQGIPFFVPAYVPGNRLNIYGSPNKEKYLEAILRGQMDTNYFPVEMNALGADIAITEFNDQEVMIGPLHIRWQEQYLHPGGSVRYAVERGKRRVVYATDCELNRIYRDGAAPNTGAPKDAAALRAEYEAFIANADLLIADAQYTEAEYPGKVGFGHSTVELITEIAHRCGVKQLAIFHHEPQHTDNMLDRLAGEYTPYYRAQRPAMEVFWAREGLTLAF